MATQVVAGLRAALLLARGREEGLRFALLSPEGAKRSFLAGALCLLPFLLIRAVGSGAVLTPGLPALTPGLPAELIGYVLGWVAFPLAALALADASGRGAQWALFVAAWNWTNLAQYLALLGVTLLGAALPGGLGGMLTLLVFGYVLWMEWFVAKTALGVTGLRAAMFVLLDLSIGLLVASAVGRLTAG